MIEVIDNTLKILAEITKSKASLLVECHDSKSTIFHSVGYEKDMLTDFIDALSEITVGAELDVNSVKELISCESLLNGLHVESCFIQNIYSLKEGKESVYLFLFLNDIEKNIHSINDVFVPVVSILSTHVNNYFSEIDKDPNSIPAALNDEKLILNNWEDNFKRLLELSEELIFFLDGTGCFLMVSNSCSLILDYTPEEMRGKHFLDIIAGEFKTLVASDINKILQSESVTKIDTVFENKLGQHIPVDITCRPVKDSGEVIGLMIVATDVSRLQQYEVELLKLKPKLVEARRLISIERSRLWQQAALLEELDRIKSEFISNISHEFRTPLASIIGFSETIVSDPDLPEEMKSEFNQVILNEGKRLARLINNVLELNNVEEGKIALNKSSIDIVELIDNVVQSNIEKSIKKKIIMDFEHPNNQLIINADGEKLAQVIEALIDNSIKFTNEDGRVKILINDLFKEVEIIISDTGVGIPEKDLPYIFQKFYRVSRPGTEIPGTGIGLVFVKQMIDMHKGMVSVQSELGNGTTFIIKFLKSFKVNS